MSPVTHRQPHLLVVLATRNERRFIRWSLHHYIDQGAEVIILDNESEDGTLELARPFLNRGLLEIRTFPFDGRHRWHDMLVEKEEVIREVRPRWALHCDPDEQRMAPPGWGTLRQATERVELDGANAVNFIEYVFVPTAEHPDHDHPAFAKTMHWYYPFLPQHPHRLTLFRPQEIDNWSFAISGGHVLHGDGVRMHPTDFIMRHYLVLSAGQMDEKYGHRVFAEESLAQGWHHNRVGLDSRRLALLPESELKDARHGLDPADPRQKHSVFRETSSLPSQHGESSSGGAGGRPRP